MLAIQTMLSALAGDGRVTIGREPLEDLRRLSDARRLACPLCGAVVVLRAGAVLSPHFAHLPGAVCAHPHAEPETEEHRAGKALLARWAAGCLPDAVVTLEAPLSETGQRADVLIEAPSIGRVALEFQCADLSGREWRRRHHLYGKAGVRDLWLLGGSRLRWSDGLLSPGELERAVLQDGAPLLFLDAAGISLPTGHLARFRPAGADANTVQLRGSLSVRPLADLAFPHRLLNWGRAKEAPETAHAAPGRVFLRQEPELPGREPDDARLYRWLRLRHRVLEEELPPFFGITVRDQEVFACAPRAWQACVYYRWIHGRVGSAWWLDEVNVWARRYMPLTDPTGRRARRALEDYQMLLSAAGLISVPHGKGRARVEADLSTLDRTPDPAAVLRLAGYRRTLARDRR